MAEQVMKKAIEIVDQEIHSVVASTHDKAQEGEVADKGTITINYNRLTGEVDVIVKKMLEAEIIFLCEKTASLRKESLIQESIMDQLKGVK